MKDFLGNELAVKDFIALDSNTGGGKQLRMGIVVAIDEPKKTLHYMLRYDWASGAVSFSRKRTQALTRVMRVHPSLVPNDMAAGLWSEVSRYV